MPKDESQQVHCVVRTAELRDASRIAAVHEASRLQAYRGFVDWELLNAKPLPEREADWIMQLNEAESLGKEIFVGEIDDRVVGFAVIGPEDGAGLGTDVAELDRIYVEPGHWARGIGKTLFRHCLEWVREKSYQRLCVWTLEPNTRARRFYESLGFALDGGRRKIEPYPDDVRYSIGVEA